MLFDQVQVLQQIFMLVVQSMQQFLATELNQLSAQDISALVHLSSLAEQILSWDFSKFDILLHFVVLIHSPFTKVYLLCKSNVEHKGNYIFH